MAELLEAVTSWWNLLLALLVFGFAPGFCLRLIVRLYPRSNPRREELIAELYAVPRMERPFWVVEQLEVALFEGLAPRVSAAWELVLVAGSVIALTTLIVLGARAMENRAMNHIDRVRRAVRRLNSEE